MPLPVVQSQPKIRRSRSARWRLAVLLLVHALIAAHITHWLVTGHTATPVEPSEATALARSGVINAGLIFFASMILLTAIFGRFFCGWACHVVALQDASAWLLGKLGRRPKPLKSRLLRYVPLIVALYVFVWPLAYRVWIERGLPRLGIELTTSEFWATFPGWLIGGLTFLICGFGVVYFLGAKGFCTYACPYGAFFAAADRLSPMRIRVTDACAGCGHCTATCTSNVRVHEEVRDFGMVVDDGCMKCLDCVSVCPNDALYYGGGPLPGKEARKAARWRRPDLSWTEEIVLAAAFVLGFLTVRGLYGAVPLLMALGLAGILAFLGLLGFRLVTRPHLKLKGLRLKRQGELLPAGWGLGAGLGLLAVLWGHSAVVRYHAYQGARAFLETRVLQAQAVDPGQPAPTLDDTQRQVFAAGAEHLERASRIGLTATAGAAAQRAWFYGLLGRTGALRKNADEAIARGELTADMHLLLARNAEATTDLAQAARHYRLASEAEPYRIEPYLGLGQTLARQGDPRGASAIFEQGLTVTPSSSGLAYNAGVARAMAGDEAGAIAFFERALALNSENLPARENLAGLLARAGRLNESAARYREALAQKNDDAETWAFYAQVLIALDRRAEAAEAIQAGRQIDPQSEALALAAAQLGQPNESRTRP